MITGQTSAVEPLVADNGSPAAPSQPVFDDAAHQKLTTLSTGLSTPVSGCLAALIAFVAAPAVMFFGFTITYSYQVGEAVGLALVCLGPIAAIVAAVFAGIAGLAAGAVAAPRLMSHLFTKSAPGRPPTNLHATAIGVGVGGLAGLLIGLLAGLIVGVPIPLLMLIASLG